MSEPTGGRNNATAVTPDAAARTKDEGDTRMGFGKYEKKTFREAHAMNPGYYKWAKKQSQPCLQMKRYIKWAHEYEGETTMGFGKYPDKTFREVRSQHPGYYRWAKDQTSPGAQLRRFLDWVEEEDKSDTKRARVENHDNSTNDANKRAKKFAGGETFTYGKYKGNSFRFVAQNDKAYVAWAKKQSEPDVQLQAFVAWVDLNHDMWQW
jgi:uncharacterized protein (DUF3820 family)